MPVSINGSGAITGVSVGGLPDGIVDADTLATNSVTTAKIASKAATSPKLGSGAVIQVVQDTFNGIGSFGINNTIYVPNAPSATLTPISASNKIFVFGCVMGIQNGSGDNNTRFLCRVTRDSTNLMNADANHWLQGGTTVMRDGMKSINYIDTAPSTNATTYKLVGYWSDTGSSQCFVNKDNNSGSSTITVMEVKA